MMDRQKGKFVVECNACGDVLDTTHSDFNAAREAMTEENWQARKNKKDEWEHFCPSCQ
jgi:hypothetical protein